MLMRALALALFLGAALGPGTPTPAIAQATEAMSVAEMMQATALDEVFSHFGAVIEASPAEQGIAFDALATAAWIEASREVFDPRLMHKALARALEGRFSPAEGAELRAFFHSDFGRRITALERALQLLDTDGQLAARAEGQALVDAMSPGSYRARQLDQMMTLVNADIAGAMMGQSVRGLLIGLSVAGQRGDIEVPWEDIDLQLRQMMPALRADVAATQRALMAYAYRDLTAAELDAYLDFLRTAPAQKFYALAAYSIGTIITDTMTRFGRAIATKLGQVHV